MRIACTIDIAAPIADVFAFVSDQALGADSTRFTQTDDLELGAPRLLHPLMRAGIRRDITHQLERLRDRLERR